MTGGSWRILASVILCCGAVAAGACDPAQETARDLESDVTPDAVPGAPGSITAERWDSHPDRLLTREDFGRWDTNDDDRIDRAEWDALVDTLSQRYEGEDR